MLPLRFHLPEGRRLSILAVGAHPDDIEIGAGGTLSSLARSVPDMRVVYVVLTGTAERRLEAEKAARAFVPVPGLEVQLHDLPEGRLPAAWNDVKDLLETLATACRPDLVLAPSAHDAHQDHRTVAELVPTAFRDAIHLGYEIPKWDGDMGRPGVYMPLSAEAARAKVDLLHSCFPSQRHRDWWDDEVFLGLARLRGMECRAPYAEAFHCSKLLILPALSPG